MQSLSVFDRMDFYNAMPLPQENEHNSVYLHPGHLFVSAEPHVVRTILGSCVAVCLWDSALKIGGVNHFLLPYGTSAVGSELRFGNLAIPRLIKRLVLLGSAKRNLSAKVFGGACVVDALLSSGTGVLGSKNAQVALEVLEAEGIPVIAEDLGGRRGRKLIFHTADASAWVRTI